MEITENTKLLESDNYVDRFKGEYWLVVMDEIIDKYKNGELDFIPLYPIELLVTQSRIMHKYLNFLGERANKYEGVTLE